METTNKTYFEWLYTILNDDDQQPRTREYKTLMADLHHMDFVGLVPNDDNRAKDGEDLRIQFMDRFESLVLPLSKSPCTVLEMLIALADRMHEIIEGEPFEMSTSKCFWLFIKNLELDSFYDGNRYSLNDVLVIVKRLVKREYDFDGRGGLFPLKKTKKDQRKTEIWYQMSEYLMENYRF